MFAGGRLCPMVGRSPLWPSAVGYFKEHRSPCRRETKAGAMEANSRRGSGRRGACRAVVTLLVFQQIFRQFGHRGKGVFYRGHGLILE